MPVVQDKIRNFQLTSKKIRIAIDVETYTADIDSTAVMAYAWMVNEYSFETPAVFHGVAIPTDDVADQLSASIGADMVL